MAEAWFAYAGPDIDESDVASVCDAVRNGFYENYREDVAKLEQRVRDITGVAYALATNSGTSALHLALASLGVSDGDEVITTDSSCVASAMPILHCGATPVLVDVSPQTWCLSPHAVEEAITPRTKAILPVHWNGHPADMAALRDIAENHNLLLIEDAAAAMGATFRQVTVGAWGDAGCFSFQGAKIAVAGQGGVLVTNCEETYNKAKTLAAYGRTDSRKPYWSDLVGWNYGMANLPAALAASQLARLDKLLQHKATIFQTYQSAFADSPHIRLIEASPDSKSSYCYPVAEVSSSSPLTRDELIMGLRDLQIDARTTQPQLSQMPMFQQRFENPISARVEESGIVLPSAYRLSADQVFFIGDAINRLLR